MSKPTVAEIRTKLEGFNVDELIISDAWILDDMDNNIIPLIEDEIGASIQAITEVTELYSGNGGRILILDNKPIVELINIYNTSNVENTPDNNRVGVILDKEQGILKRINSSFRKGQKNISVTYTHGFTDANLPNSIKQGIIFRECISIFTQLANRTGGGNTGIKSYSPDYGNRGKYSNIRDEWSRMASRHLSKYGSAVVGD